MTGVSISALMSDYIYTPFYALRETLPKLSCKVGGGVAITRPVLVSCFASLTRKLVVPSRTASLAPQVRSEVEQLCSNKGQRRAKCLHPRWTGCVPGTCDNEIFP